MNRMMLFLNRKTTASRVYGDDKAKILPVNALQSKRRLYGYLTLMCKESFNNRNIRHLVVISRRSYQNIPTQYL